MRRPTALLLSLALASISCSRADPPAPERTSAETPPAPAERPEPAPPPLPAPRDVSFTTSDGVTIAGTLHGGATPDAPLVVLVHQLGSTRAEWEPLVERLRAHPALAILAIDLRGHGESTRGAEGSALAWREFDNATWARTADDVVAAVEFVRSEASGVRPARIGLVGSSIGSTAVVAAAARTPDIGPVVAISPGRAYRGFDAITPALELAGHPFLAVVAREEPDSVETAQAMARITSTEALIVDGSEHGVALLRAHPEVLDRVEQVLRSALGAEREG